MGDRRWRPKLDGVVSSSRDGEKWTNRKWCQQDTDIDCIRGKGKGTDQGCPRVSMVKTGWPFSFHTLISTHWVTMAHQVTLGRQQAVCMKLPCKGQGSWMLWGALEPAHAAPKCFPSEELPEQVTRDFAKTTHTYFGKLLKMLRAPSAETKK